MASTTPLQEATTARNECRMLMNVARYYDVISQIVTILDSLVISQINASLLQVVHRPETKCIVINYGEPEDDGKSEEVGEVEQEVESDRNVVEEVDVEGIVQELPEDVIIEEQVEDEFFYVEEEGVGTESMAEDTDEIQVQVFDLVKEEHNQVEEYENDQFVIEGSQNDEVSEISEYYVEYLQEVEEISQDANKMVKLENPEDSNIEEVFTKPDTSFLFRYKCQFLSCNKKFAFSKQYDEHFRREHPGIVTKPILLQCKHIDCKNTFDDTYKLHIHHKQHKMQQRLNKNGTLSCQICRESFNTKLAFRKHIKEHSQESVVKAMKQNFKRKCQFCDEVLDSKINVYNIHCLEKHGKAPYNCFICGKGYFLLAHVNEHVKADHSVESVRTLIDKSLWRSFSIDDTTIKECRMCFRLFASPKAELQHQESHTKELSITCTICGGKHYESQCSEPRPKFTSVYEKVQCDQCQRWMSKKNIKEHKATHMSERNFPCTVCKKTFKVQRTAHRHIQNHINAENRLRKCYDCDQEYTDEDFLVEHYEQAHPDKRPYNCLICGEGFYRKTLLGDHSHMHSDEDRRRISVKNPVEHYQIRNARVYECTLCRRSFSAKRTTVAHFIVHTDRPFVCEHCSMSFRMKTSLEDHLLDVHKIKA
ncbi:AAEL000305-PA [Aedes aegypti]|uniref:AAEL000305-PA n=2 Tax=Aedes aegypti TaxID=7159 RepID=A0A1S4EVG5_AEDAE|nr:zinc finger protein 60 [Aedes aegypti]EAT48650.1 AAEL000305-PA [Aedes aegypti]